MSRVTPAHHPIGERLLRDQRRAKMTALAALTALAVLIATLVPRHPRRRLPDRSHPPAGHSRRATAFRLASSGAERSLYSHRPDTPQAVCRGETADRDALRGWN